MEKDTQLLDYLLNRLSEPERLAFERQLALDTPLQYEAEALQQTWQTFQELESEPTAAMDTAFYALLDQEKQNQALEQRRINELEPKPVIRKLNWLPYAAALAGFGLMFWLGRLTVEPTVEVRTITMEVPKSPPVSDFPKETLPPESIPAEEVAATQPQKKASRPLTGVQHEIASLRKELKLTQELVILGLLRKESAADRLKGLQYASNLSELKPEVIRSLAHTLRTDESINVRLATIETLRNYGQYESVRKAFLERLDQATELPEQVSIMETLVSLNEKEAIPHLKKVANDETAEPIIRKKAQQSIQLLLI